MKSLVLGALLAAGIAVTGARAGVIEEFEAEDWDGIAYADDDTGAFHNCIVFAAYRNGGTLMMIRTVENTWAITIAHDAWQLSPDETHRLEYTVDGGRAVQVEAEALNADQLTIAADEGLIEQIRRGKELKITFDGKEYAFDLANSGKALKAAADCVERHRGTVQQAAAPAPKPEAAAPTEAPPAPPAAETQAAPPVAEAPAEDGTASTLGDRQTFGHWVVTAVDDGAGNFLNCSAFGLYGEDEQLILSYTPQGKWEFGLWRADWSLPTDAAYFLWYNVDKTVDEPGVMKRPVEAAEPTRIFFEVSSLETLTERAATGQQLNLQLRGVGIEPQSLSYSLDQAGAALEATKACVAQHVAQAQSADASDDVVVEPDAGEEVVVEPEASETVQVDPPSASEAAEAGQSGQEQQTAAGPSLPPLDGEKIETLEVPGWEGGAYADESGSFTHCGISAEYQNGTELAFARTADNSLILAFARADWSLQSGEWSPIRYSYGKDFPINVEGQGQAHNDSMFLTNLGRDDMFLNELKQAPELKAEVQGHNLSFDISDLAPGLEAIDQCRQRHLAAAAPAASAAPEAGSGEDTGVLEEFQVEDWKAAAYKNDTGGLSHCAAFATYQNGLTLYLVKIANGGWRFGLMNPGKWNLPQDSAIPVRYQIDASPERAVQGIPTGEATLVVDVDGPVMTQEIASGSELVTEIEGERFAFDLGNADKAVPAVEQCVARHGGDGIKPSPKAKKVKAEAPADAAPDTSSVPATTETAAEESRGYVADLLTRAGYPEHHMIFGDDIPEGFQSYDAVWEIGEIRGMVRVQPLLQGVAPAQVRDEIVAGDRNLCKGEFSSSTMAEGTADGAILFASTCEDPDWTYSVVYSVVPRPQGGSYIITHMGVGDGEAARAIGSKLYETALL